MDMGATTVALAGTSFATTALALHIPEHIEPFIR